MKTIHFYKELQETIDACSSLFDTIPQERKNTLESVAEIISNKVAEGLHTKLVFICTHNSRRSQFGQVWAKFSAAAYGLENVHTFSAGTEETAFNPNAISALRRAGFKIEEMEGANPHYQIRYADDQDCITGFSKTLEHDSLPKTGFVALMTCSDADENCPIVHGTEKRIRLTYDDPKVADHTPQEKEVYDERCKQIATEMLYLFSKTV